jgi:hypothetical protein
VAQLLRQVDHPQRTLDAAEIDAVIAQTLAREALATEQGHADAEDLTGAEVAVRGFGHGQEFVEGFHCSRCYA